MALILMASARLTSFYPSMATGPHTTVLDWITRWRREVRVANCPIVASTRATSFNAYESLVLDRL
jgi:hypothetical protein